MLEQVTIVLNEREPLKKKAAEEITAALTERKITSSRPAIGPKIEQLLLSIDSQVLVLDYVLGDYSTGLDVLDLLTTRNDRNTPPPAVILFTDEPSLDVAVKAMRLGAENFIVMDSPGATLTLIEQIEGLIIAKRTQRHAVIAEDLSLDDLTVNSQLARKSLQKLRELILEGTNPLVFFGAEGSGKKHWAKATFGELGLLPIVQEVDIRFHKGPFSELLQPFINANEQGALHFPGALLLHHIDSDEGGELLTYLETTRGQLFEQRTNGHPLCYLFATTTDSPTATAWVSLLGAGSIGVPPLTEERLEDFPSLVQDTIDHLSTAYSMKFKPISAQEIKWLSSQKWRRNIQQLRSVVTQALTASLADDRAILELLQEAFAFSDEELLEEQGWTLNLFEAARLFDRNGGNIRLTAAQLGCSLPALKKLLGREAETPPADSQEQEGGER